MGSPKPWRLERTVTAGATPLVLLDLAGTFAFALNGAFTALRAARLDIVGVVTLGMITALGGGTIRDILLDSLPPATFVDWPYLAVAATGGLVAFVLGRHRRRARLRPCPPPGTAQHGDHRAGRRGAGTVRRHRRPQSRGPRFRPG